MSATPDPTPSVADGRLRDVPWRVLIPNLVTLMVLAAGLTAVRYAVEGRILMAVVAMTTAAILDGLDGRLARLLKGTSRFGAELDSLADFIAFGCGPALVLYFWQLQNLETVGWLGALSIAFAAALRLARFNVMLDDPTRPEWKKRFFVGVPAPAGAMMAILPINLVLAGLPEGFRGHAWIVLFWTVFVAFMMVSRFPTLSGKGGGKEYVPRDRLIPIVALVVGTFAMLFSHPFATLSVLTLIYIGSLPLALIRYRRFEQNSDTQATG